MYSTIHSFIQWFVHSFIKSIIQWFINLFVPSRIHSFIHPSVNPFIHSFNDPSIHQIILSSIFSFIRSLNDSFMYACMHSFIHNNLFIWYPNPLCILACKFSISRSDIVLGRILGEGFFGEVHDGIYKSKVSHTYRPCVMSPKHLEITRKTSWTARPPPVRRASERGCENLQGLFSWCEGEVHEWSL